MLPGRDKENRHGSGHPSAARRPNGCRRLRRAGGRPRRVRHHRRPREGDDVPLAVPARSRGLLNCPIVGVAVDDWSIDELRATRAQRSGAPGSASTTKCSRASPSGSPTSRATSATPARSRSVAKAIAQARTPVFYLEIPPFLFATVIKGLSEAGLTKNARVVVEKPFGHDLESARALAADIHQYIDESQLYRIDHFLGKMGLEEFLYLRFANSMLEPVWNRNHVASVADHDGRELRRRGSRPLLRPRRRAARRRRQPPDAAARRGGDGGAGRRRRARR